VDGRGGADIDDAAGAVNRGSLQDEGKGAARRVDRGAQIQFVHLIPGIDAAADNFFKAECAGNVHQRVDAAQPVGNGLKTRRRFIRLRQIDASDCDTTAPSAPNAPVITTVLSRRSRSATAGGIQVPRCG